MTGEEMLAEPDWLDNLTNASLRFMLVILNFYLIAITIVMIIGTFVMIVLAINKMRHWTVKQWQGLARSLENDSKSIPLYAEDQSMDFEQKV